MSSTSPCDCVLGSYMENVILDMADLDAGVLCCWSVLQQRLEPGRSRGNCGSFKAADRKTKIKNKHKWLPGRSCKQQNFVCIKGLPLHQEGDVRHLLVVQEVRV